MGQFILFTSIFFLVSWIQNATHSRNFYFSSTKHLIELIPAQHVYKTVRQTICPVLVLNKEINILQYNSLVRSNHPLSQKHKGSKFIMCLLPLLSHSSTPLFYKSFKHPDFLIIFALMHVFCPSYIQNHSSKHGHTKSIYINVSSFLVFKNIK